MPGDCIFCKIGNKDIPSEMIYEDGHAFAVLDIRPVAPGHTMVISKTHSATILDLPDAEVGPLFLAVKNITAKLDKALNPHGFTIGINHGSVSGQVVEHLHIHVIPRFEGDNGKSIHSVVNNLPKETIPRIAEKIRAAG